MSKKKKVTAPTYSEMEDNDYITQQREQVNNLYDKTYSLLEGLDTTSEDVQNEYKQIANDYTQSQWDDLNRSYTGAVNKLNQTNYNRMGTLGSTSALYNTESLQRDYNDMATSIASNTASQYQSLINNAYNQRYNTYQAYNNAYNTAGNVTTTQDERNWQIGNLNTEAQYLADVQNANNSGGWSWSNALTGAISGAATGSKAGWVGALAGGVLGGVSGGLSGDSSSSSSLGSSSGSLFSNLLNSSNTSTSSNTGYGSNGSLWSLNTTYNPTSWKFSW